MCCVLRIPVAVTLLIGICQAAEPAAEIVLPQGRQAYYSSETIELAVSGLDKGAAATIAVVPEENDAKPIQIRVQGDGGAATVALPPFSLAPGSYTIRLDDKQGPPITVASGVVDSTLLLSQTIRLNQLHEAGANFIVGNAFSFGRFAPGSSGPLTTNLRAGHSAGMNYFEQAINLDLPDIIYMYWTGYVTHKPFGTEKSWANSEMNQAMRLLSFHAAQRLRRFAPHIVSVGTLDEPGLSWGRTPAGGSASGFPNWDEKPWYAERGWQFTDDPASRSDDDWMKYLAIRCAIMKEGQGQASRDLHAVWPEVVFSTDLYAPHAIMDGTDPLNQEVNQIPSSHVFVDWGIDRLGTYSGVMLEKAHNPSAKLAHAMNGQLFSKRVPQPGQSYAYRAALNGMLAAGLSSNWWLNTGGMQPADLAAVNEPAKRIGPLFRACEIAGHDVAVLWSFSEIGMREKAIAAKEASKQSGEQIKLMVASLPENSAISGKEMNINAYNIGGDYKEAVLTAHYALARCGYPAHILHERILGRGILANYKTLVIVGQTFPLAADAQAAIESFVRDGGQIIVDKSTTIDLPGAIVADVKLAGLSYRWSALFLQDAKTFKTPREASYFKTNHFMDEPVRQAVAPLKAALRRTRSQPRLESDSDELLAERHQAGEGFLALVASGNEKLPEIGEEEEYWIYNYAPLEASFKLESLPEQCVVYALEGADWSRTSKLADPQAAIEASFEPAEMKLYLVAPREPTGLAATAVADGGQIRVEADLKNLKMPWPLTLTLTDPAGKVRYKVYRATTAAGTYRERFPLGSNAAPGRYTVSLSSPLAGLAAEATVDYQPQPAAAQPIAGAVRVFDEDVIRHFLAGKPELTIAYGAAAHKPLAEKLAAALSQHGLKAAVKPENQVLHKARYPRVWNPYAHVYRPGGSQESLEGKTVEHEITLGTAADGTLTLHDKEGKPLTDWKIPNSLVTIVADGYVDWIADSETCYEPGVKLYVDDKRRVTVLNAEKTDEATTAQFKAKWARPWSRLITHVGGYQFPPQLPEAYQADGHLILLGDSTTSTGVAALQASDLLLEVVDAAYPGPGKALVSFAWSPFAVEKNVILLGASDAAGLEAAISAVAGLAPGK